MLTSLSLTHFKSWPEIRDLRLVPITGLFGTNSSGKTSILQLLLLLKQTADSPDRAQTLHLGDERSLVSLGTFQDVVYEHVRSRTLHWALSWLLPRELKVANPELRGGTLFSGREMKFEAEVTEGSSGRLVVNQMSYRFDQHEFRMTREANAEGKYTLLSTPADFQFRRTQGRPWPLPHPVKCYGFPDQVRAYYQNAGFLSDFELALEELFSRLYYLGPLREYPRREYLWAGARPADMGRRGERVVDAILGARAEGVKISRGKGRPRLTLEEYVALKLRELNLLSEFSIERIAEGSNLYQVRVRQSPTAPEVLLPDVGFGVSQILPVLVLCYYVPEGSIILLEQPEIHLHPRVQADLADVFIDAVKRRGVQIILESHSEHLLRRLQRRIAEEKFQSEDTALYFCTLANGASSLTELQLDLFGNIVNWPDGFFGDEFAEMAAMTRAAMERKQREKAGA